MSVIVKIDITLKSVNSFTKSGFSYISRQHERLKKYLSCSTNTYINENTFNCSIYVNSHSTFVCNRLFLRNNAIADLPRRTAMLVNFAGQGEGRFTRPISCACNKWRRTVDLGTNLREWHFPFIHRTVDSDRGCLEGSIRMAYCAAFYCNANSSKN